VSRFFVNSGFDLRYGPKSERSGGKKQANRLAKPPKSRPEDKSRRRFIEVPRLRAQLGSSGSLFPSVPSEFLKFFVPMQLEEWAAPRKICGVKQRDKRFNMFHLK